MDKDYMKQYSDMTIEEYVASHGVDIDVLTPEELQLA